MRNIAKFLPQFCNAFCEAIVRLRCICLYIGIYTAFVPPPLSAQTLQTTYVPDGVVNAVAYNAGTVYLGGTFNQLFPSSAPMIGSRCVLLDAASGDASAMFPIVNGAVHAIIPDGSGGWYIGGNFSLVGGVTRNRIAHILNTGAVDMAWNPNANGVVYTLALSGATLYVGGGFGNIGGQPRNYIAALDVGTGNATLWNPSAVGFYVSSLAVSGTTVYAGGDFTNIGGQPRNRIAALDAMINTNNATTWNPNANAPVSAIAISGTTVYVGGEFTNIGGQPRNRIAALDATIDANNATAWNPDAIGGSVFTLALDAGIVYAGGNFTNIGGQPRNYIAALDAGTGLATAWNPNANNQVKNITISGTTVYAVGFFSIIGGQPRNYIAALDAMTDVNNATAWNPVANGTVNSLAVSGGQVCVGGDFTACGIPGRVVRRNIAALDAATGEPTAWNPNANGNVLALAISGSTVYAGGNFVNIGGQPRNYLAALDAGTGNATTWNPNANNSVRTIAVNGATVYAGGTFTNIGGQPRNRLAALDAGTGLATAWNPNPTTTQVNTVVVNGSTVYVGALAMTAIGGSFRNNVGAVDAVSGLATAWDANAGGTSVSGIAINGSTVYVGGNYSSLGGSSRTGLGAVDIASAILNPWDPNPILPAGQLALAGSTLYVGGSFTTISGQPRNRLAAYNAATNTLEAAWTPSANDGVFDIAVGPAWVYVGGNFTAINGDNTKQYFAAISLAAPATATYVWSGGAGANWQDAANWTPTRTTPAPTDILQFLPGAHSPSNVPSETIGQLDVSPGAIVTLNGSVAPQTLTVNSSITIPAASFLNLAPNGAPTPNHVTLAMGAGANLTVNGVLNVSTASVVGSPTSAFTLSAGATLMTARPDGINGSAPMEGSVQGFSPGMVSYSNMANYVLTTALDADGYANTAAVGSKPAITQTTNLFIWGSNAFPNRPRIFSAAPPLTVQGSCVINGRTVADAGAVLNLNGATAINRSEIVVLGDVTIGMAGTLNVQGNQSGKSVTLEASGNLASLTAVPTTYFADAHLTIRNAWSGIITNAALPPLMSGHVSVEPSASVTLNGSKTILGSLYVGGTLDCGAGGLVHSVAGATTIDAAGVMNLSGQTLALAATNVIGGGNFIGSNVSNLLLNGAFTGALTFQSPNEQLGDFTVNLGAGNAIQMGSMLTVHGLLALVSGRIVPNESNSWHLSVENTALGAVARIDGYVDGPLRRRLAANIAIDGSDYFFPIGEGATYRPLTLRNARTGGSSEEVEARFFGSGASLAAPPLTSVLPQNWRLVALGAGGYQSSTIELDATGVPPGYGVGMASGAQTGPYASIFGSASGPTRASAAQGALAPVGVGVPNARYFGFGILGPSITSFSPSTVNTGDTVVIIGANFDGVSTVGFGGVPAAAFQIISSTEIRAVAGEGSTGQITLISPFGVIVSANQIVFSNAPGVARIAPTFGSTGATVILTGVRFDGANGVSFGGVPASSFTVISPTSIQAVVGALTVASGSRVGVRVQTPNGSSVLPEAFTFYRPPIILDFSPKVARAGDTLRITGGEFIGVQNVRLGGRATPFTVLSTTSILVVVPAVASGGAIVVENFVGSVAAREELTVVGQPVIAQVTPNPAAVGQTLSIFGAEFYPNALVRIGETFAASVTRASLGELRAQFAVATAGTLTVVSSGGTASYSMPVAIVAPPVFRGFSPQEPLAGEPITLLGENFPLTNVAVSVGGVAVPATVQSSTRITIVVPANLVGIITITTPGGVARSSAPVRPISPPTILSFQPAAGMVGSALEIRGTNLQRVQSVTLGGVEAAFAEDSAQGLLRVIAPSFGGAILPFSSSSATLRVVTLGGAAQASMPFIVLPPPGPIIAGFSPVSLVEGEPLRIVGANIPPSARIFLDETPVPDVEIAADVISLRVPVGIVPGSMFATQATIRLVTETVSTGAALSLTIFGVRLPRIVDFTPKIGGKETPIIIRGENFNVPPRGLIQHVRIGGKIARSFRVDSSSAMVVIPGDVASGVIEVETNAGRISTREAFEFDSTIVPIPPTLAQDSIALERLYEATGGGEWTINAGWRNRAPIAARFGVRTENGRVVELRLANNNLRGALPSADIFNALTALRVLDLSRNALGGSLSVFIGGAPPKIFDVSYNQLSGVAQDLCRLNAAEIVNVAHNRLSGALPTCVGENAAWTSFNAGSNEFSGSLPPNVGNAPNLQTLNLADNRFSGEIPSEWGAEFPTQALAGSIEKNGARLSATQTLTTLDLSRNQLSGALPPNLGNYRSLRELRVAGNRLSGAVPASFANLLLLTTFDASDNALTGVSALAGLPRLDAALVANNNLNFAELEPLTRAATLRYAPQNAPPPTATDTTVTFDFPLELNAALAGENNTYLWLKDGQPIAADDGKAKFVVPAFAPPDTGEYRCVVGNKLLPELSFNVLRVRARGVMPTSSPEGALVLLSPFDGEDEVSRAPVFSWKSLPGAARYEIECSLDSSFGGAAFRGSEAQTRETLANGIASIQTANTVGFPLPALTRAYWRARAVNSRGAGEWTPSARFITSAGDAALSVPFARFGGVPLGDSASRVIDARNRSARAVRVFSLRPASDGVAETPFTIQERNLGLPRVLAPEESLPIPVAFVPRALGESRADIVVQYRFAEGGDTTLYAQRFPARLFGRGAALKILPPLADTLLVGVPRLLPARIVNVAPFDATIQRLRLRSRIEPLAAGQSPQTPYELLSNESATRLAGGDTLLVTLRAFTDAAGEQPADALSCDVELSLPASFAGAPATDTAVVALRSFARARLASDAVARLGARAVPPQAPPGTSVRVEVVILEADFARLRELPSYAYRGVLRLPRNVLALSPESALRISPAPDNSEEYRAQIPQTFWNARDSVLFWIPTVAVAGQTDSGGVILESFAWESSESLVQFSDFAAGSFRALLSRAGGSRFIAPIGTRIISASPNPAHSTMEISWMFAEREDSQTSEQEAEIALVDSRGADVQTLWRGKEQRGTLHKESFRVEALPSGYYTIVLRIGGRTTDTRGAVIAR